MDATQINCVVEAGEQSSQANSPTQSKLLGNECTQIDLGTFQQQNNSHIKTEDSVDQQISDSESQPQNEDQLLSNDDQSSEHSNDASSGRNKFYPNQRSKLSSPKSSSENTLDDRRLRRQIANSNERRRMQASFQALRQFLPQRSGEKLSKAAILQQTAELIQNLQLEKGRRPDCRPTSDEEANVEERPSAKKRRIAVKSEQKEREEENSGADAGHSEISQYTKVIEELKSALGKEQQLRLLYEQKLVDLKTTLSASLGFGSLPGGINLDRTENSQQNAIHQRSVSADGGLLAPKNLCDLSNNSAFLNNNLATVTEAALVQNMRMARPATSGSLAALLSPTQLNGMHFGGASPFAQQLLTNQNVVNILAASLQQASPELHSLNGHTSANQSPTGGVQQPTQNILFALAEALRQIENENSKFPTEMTADVLVR
ncbi:BHLH domain-containing protein [Aphelenchoides bicaudatus]|nr:BHLH domain-containing protein [Aphelenchoides bicaudatus]